MKSLMAVFSISVLVAIAFTSGAQGILWGPEEGDGSIDVVDPVNDVLQTATGAVNSLVGGLLPSGGIDVSGISSLVKGNNSAVGQLVGAMANETAELVVHTVTVIGIVIASVQQILDGICDLLFQLYDGFLYPILDCLFAILGLTDAICAISEQPCIEDLLFEISQDNCSELAGVVQPEQQDGLIGAAEPVAEGPKIDVRRKREIPPPPPPPPAPAANGTEVVKVSHVNKFIEKFKGEDRQFAVLTLRLVALVIQITVFASVHTHLLPIILCVEQRERYGYNEAGQACRQAGKTKAGKSGGEGKPGGGGGGGLDLGNLLGGLGLGK